ncbi:putative teichoic acid biosynthesis protein [Legionella moravica]|uniref:Teichoic acid biosynthesis protein n=1 Tax=Legionella moravica TaxID=39962 RepID=A0A378K4P3_9GAMM|nr:TcdA/TcdB catalytic glycosyltransferase domain-containing protein [Legionella moravica]KTD38454.1 putative teichoic acid biosynthesis protein [Legionella moravica]STX62851.1 putative teichoic acid biosynthesis protein [Legionella moravica]
MPEKIIPKKLHAIWLGGTLRDVGEKNLIDWKKQNPDYTLNLWVDSRTYLTSELQESYKNLILRAKTNGIVINDINPDIKEQQRLQYVNYPREIYENMASSKYYEDELFIQQPNYAAASDILRAEILYHQGGIYFDAEDVFPGEPLGNLSCRHGILIHKTTNGLNNDLIASEVNGTMIDSYRKVIQQNYNELYSLPLVHQLAHQSQFYESHRTTGRKDSTINISGPGALAQAVNAVNKGLATTYGMINNAVAMDPKTYTLPPKQALSWYNTEAASNPDMIIAQFRSNVKDYFNMLVEYIGENNLHPQSIETLNKCSRLISEFPPTKTMVQLMAHLRENLSQKEMDTLKNIEIPIAVKDEFGSNFWDRLEHYAQTTDAFVVSIKTAEVKEELLGSFMKELKDNTTLDSYIVDSQFTEDFTKFSFPYFLHRILPQGYNALVENHHYSHFSFSCDPSVKFKPVSAEQQVAITQKVAKEFNELTSKSSGLSSEGFFAIKSELVQSKHAKEIELISDYIKQITASMERGHSKDLKGVLKDRTHGFVAGISRTTGTAYVNDRFMSARFAPDGTLSFHKRENNQSPWREMTADEAVKTKGLFKQIVAHQQDLISQQVQSAGSKFKG